MAEALVATPGNFWKWQLCVLVEGQTVMVTVIREVFKSLESTSNGTVTLKEYLHNEGWKKDEMEQLCTQYWQHLLKEDLMTADFDISFASKLLTKVFTDVYDKLSESCQQSIKDLKSKRNKLSHCFFNEHSKNLNIENEVSNLLTTFMNIYRGVEEVINADFSDLVRSTERNLQSILKASHENYNNYEQKVKDFKDTLSHTLIRKGQEELMDYYKRLRVVNPCSWMLERDFAQSSVKSYYIEKIYTPLKIEDCRDYEILAKELMRTEKTVRGRSVIPGALLLHGLAGCGKTSLCRYILHSWSDAEDMENIEGMHDFDLVILVEARLIKGRKLEEFLSYILSKTYKEISDAKVDPRIDVSVENDIIDTLRDLSVLFIIDGFDENCKDASVILEDIITKLGSHHRIIVTTRPEFLSKVDSCLKYRKFDYLMVKICGFDDDRRKEFTNKVFNVALEKKADHQRKRESERFHKYIRGRGRILGEHLRLPLTLALLIYLWIDKVKDSGQGEQVLSEVTNCTTLYFQLFKLCQKKLKQRIKNEDIKDVKIEELLLFIGEKAWKNLELGQVYITEEDRKEIEDKCEKLGIDKVNMMSAFLMYEYNENDDSKDEGYYSFLHKTQMEYLAAQYLARQKLQQETAKVNKWEEFQQVIIFLIGHITLLGHASFETLKYIFKLAEKAMVQEGSYDFWWKFLVEAKKQKKVGEIIAREHLPRDIWKLDEIKMIVPGLELLISTPAKIETLQIVVDSCMDPYDIENLWEVMKELRFKLRGRYDKGNPILTELHFWRHNEYKCDKPSDDLLRTLNPWGHLTNLTGSLGEQERGEEILKYCFKLKTLRVRLCSVEAVISLSFSLEKIYKSIRNLRVTLDFSSSVNAHDLPSLTTNGNLEVTIPGVSDEDKEWVVAVVKNVSCERGSKRGQGCRRLVLDKSELTCDAVKYLINKLKRVVTEKLSVETNCNITVEDKESVAAMENKTHIIVIWI